MIPYSIGTEFKDTILSQLQETVMTEPVFIEPSGKCDYIIYDVNNQMICFLQCGEKRDGRYGPYEHFVRRIMTRYTTYPASFFKPEDVRSFVSAIESVYQKQKESESTDEAVKERNKRKFEIIKRKKNELDRIASLCESLAM